MRVALLRGWRWRVRDRAASWVAAVVGRAAAPEGAAVGRTLRLGREGGTVVLVALGLLAVLLTLGVAAVDIGLLVAGRAAAQTAADLAALGSLTASSLPPHRVAGEVAAANGARLAGCTCAVDQSVVTVTRPVRLLPTRQEVLVRARARARLPSVPLYPAGLPGGVAAVPPGGGAAAALLADPRLTLTPHARADLERGVVDPRLTELLAGLLRRHTLAVSVFRSGHSRHVDGTRTVSLHALGRGVDIHRVDGGQVGPGHQPSLAVVAALDQLTGPRRPSEVGSPFPQYETAAGHFSDADHHDHLHIGVG